MPNIKDIELNTFENLTENKEVLKIKPSNGDLTTKKTWNGKVIYHASGRAPGGKESPYVIFFTGKPMNYEIVGVGVHIKANTETYYVKWEDNSITKEFEFFKN